MPADAVARYESLREAVVQGQPRGEGAAALRYHGMLHGIALIGQRTPSELSARVAIGAADETRSPPDSDEFIRLLANLVLRTQPELHHVD